MTKNKEMHYPSNMQQDTDEIFDASSVDYMQLPRKWVPILNGIWIAIALFTTLLFVFGLPHRYIQLLNVTPATGLAIQAANLTPMIRALWLLAVELLMMLSFTILASVIYAQKSENAGTFVLSLALFIFGTTIFSSLNGFALAFPDLAYLTRIARALSWLLLLWMFYFFPDGRFQPKWTGWLAAGWFIWTITWLIFPDLPHNPTRPGEFSDPVRFGTYLFWFGSGVLSQIIRYRKYASAVERQQTKWAVYGFAIAVGGTFLEELPSVFDSTLVAHLTAKSIWYQLISTSMFAFSAMALPISLALSISRKRLWKIDFWINRSLVYTTLTTFLGLVFFGLLLLLQQFFTLITGNGQSSISIIVSVAAVILLFQPARMALREFVDRNLYGIKLRYRSPSIFKHFFAKSTTQFEIDQYLVFELIGRGGMSEVYKGRHREQEHDVAIKLLLPHMAEQRNFRIRFEREAQIMSDLQHPNIVDMLDYGKNDGKYFMVLELYDGGDLREHLKSVGRLTMKEALPLLQEVAAALDYAHEAGMVHRDVKPSNIMLNAEKTTSAIADFGIVKLVSEDSGITKTGIVGTFDYISPEQIQAQKNIDRRTDVYALGVMTYQILTGELPFESTNPGQILLAHMNQPAPDPRMLIPDLPGIAARAIGRAMSKEKEKRFATAGDFIAALAD